MSITSTRLDKQGRDIVRVSNAMFLGRLQDKNGLEWALSFKEEDLAKKIGVLEAVNANANSISEPWLTAWRIIEEYWEDNKSPRDRTTDKHYITARLKSGERTGTIVNHIVDYVSVRLKIEKRSKLDYFYKPTKKIKTIEDLFNTSLDSCEVFEPDKFMINKIEDVDFLYSLAMKLESSILDGIDLVLRIQSNPWVKKRWLEDISRVYYVPESKLQETHTEPDRYKRGFSAPVKILHAVMTRLSDTNIEIAKNIVNRWKHSQHSIFTRLWASLSISEDIASNREVGEFLISIGNEKFWKVTSFPEIAELRAIRYGSLETSDRNIVSDRILKFPPRIFWPKNLGKDEVANARIYSAVRELKRIVIGGYSFEGKYLKWYLNNVDKFSDLKDMDQIDFGFLNQSKARAIPPNPDEKYDSLTGETRLKVLEKALNSKIRSWENDPAERASDWISSSGNLEMLINDLSLLKKSVYKYTSVWERVLWAQSRNTNRKNEHVDSTHYDLAVKLFCMLENFPDENLIKCIDGATRWFQSWYSLLENRPSIKRASIHKLWHKFWEISVAETDLKFEAVNEEIHSSLDDVLEEEEVERVDTLNTPAGRMVYIFLEMCPDLTTNRSPFRGRSKLRNVRDSILNSTNLGERSGLVARHILIERLGYFLNADEKWATVNLVEPLKADTRESNLLWKAISRDTLYRDVIKSLEALILKKIVDPKLERESRESLLFSILIDYLGATYSERQPVINRNSIQQVLRSVDAEIRSHGAYTIYRFISELSLEKQDGKKKYPPNKLFESVIKPFIINVWPQEILLVTPRISKYFSKIPAHSGTNFVNAVGAIDRFLIPFDCWSMHDFGLDFDSGEDGERNSGVLIVNTSTKAKAFLNMIDLCIGTEEGSVIPYDLSKALDHIDGVSPGLKSLPSYKRLKALIRRH